MRITKLVFGILALILISRVTTNAQDPGWPRKLVKPSGVVIIYQPQVDEWLNFSDIKWRQAFQLTPTGGKEIVGALSLEGSTEVNTGTHTVFMYNIRVLNTYFPSQDPATTAQMDQLIRNFVPPTFNASLDRLIAYMPKPQSLNTVTLKNDPPYIFVSYTPAILLGVDGEPVLSDISKTDLKYVVNTQWPLLFDKSKSQYYLLVNNLWLSAGDLHGPWMRATKLSKAFDKLPESGRFSDVKKMIPPPAIANPVIPQVFYSTVPAEVILFDGQPTYSGIPPTQLMYANNTDSPVFVYNQTGTFYYLAAGRWFSAASLTGPWTFASLNLPPDFANIPLSSPASAILASVPGTSQAKDAVLIAQIPTVMTINATTAAAQAKVSYTGEPQFAPIDGTTLQYATNTPDKVIQVGDVYYLCLQGVWFMSTTPQGPWTTASSVPQVIYTIPPSSPVYNVTYVTQVTTSTGYGGLSRRVCDGRSRWSDSGERFRLLLPALHRLPNRWLSRLSSVSHLLWGVRCLRYFLLSQQHGSVRRFANSVWRVWLSHAHCVVQPLHRHRNPDCLDINGLWKAKRGSSLQSVHGFVRCDVSGLQPNCAMGELLRLSRR
jgi:hypothetical protein